MVQVTPRPADTWDAWQMIYRTVRVELTHALRRVGVSVEEHEVLLALMPAPQLTLSSRNLAIALRRETSNCVRLVLRMEERGLVVRVPSPEQRNERWVQLTADGFALGETARRARVEKLRAVLDRHLAEGDEEVIARLAVLVVPAMDHTRLVYPNNPKYRDGRPRVR